MPKICSLLHVLGLFLTCCAFLDVQTHFGYLSAVFWILVTAKYAKISLYVFLRIYN